MKKKDKRMLWWILGIVVALVIVALILNQTTGAVSGNVVAQNITYGSTKCTDTDGGNNPWLKGTATSVDLRSGTRITAIDFCDLMHPYWDWSRNQKNYKIVEAYCTSTAQIGRMAPGTCNNAYCINGACKGF